MGGTDVHSPPLKVCLHVSRIELLSHLAKGCVLAMRNIALLEWGQEPLGLLRSLRTLRSVIGIRKRKYALPCLDSL